MIDIINCSPAYKEIKNRYKMEKMFNVFNLTLFIVSYAILIIPALLILLIANAVKQRGLVKIFDTDIIQKYEG